MNNQKTYSLKSTLQRWKNFENYTWRWNKKFFSWSAITPCQEGSRAAIAIFYNMYVRSPQSFHTCSFFNSISWLKYYMRTNQHTSLLYRQGRGTRAVIENIYFELTQGHWSQNDKGHRKNCQSSRIRSQLHQTKHASNPSARHDRSTKPLVCESHCLVSFINAKIRMKKDAASQRSHQSSSHSDNSSQCMSGGDMFFPKNFFIMIDYVKSTFWNSVLKQEYSVG